MPRTSPSERTRDELFTAFIAQMNSAEIQYCLLCGYERHAAGIAGDVDFMVHPGNMHRVASLLMQAARSAGGLLVQAIEHETTGCYYVLAKPAGGRIGYLNPDCSGDYRRQQRLWLRAGELLASRRWCRGSYAPSVADEFSYYLIKKVLKQSISESQLRRLQHLYQRDPVRCTARTLKFWSLTTSDAVQRAVVQQDLGWFRTNRQPLLAELVRSAPVENMGQRWLQGLRNGKRIVERLLRPTGMSALVCGGEKARRLAIAGALQQSLAPAFRQTQSVRFDGQDFASTQNLRLAARVRLNRLRSTLTVGTVDGSENFAMLMWFAARVLFRPDVIFVLRGGEAAAHTLPTREGSNGSTVYLNTALAIEQNLEVAARTILHWLSRRMARRLGLDGRRGVELPASTSCDTQPVCAVTSLEQG